MVSSYHVHDKYALYVKLFYHCFFFFFLSDRYRCISSRRENFWNGLFDRFDSIKEIAIRTIQFHLWFSLECTGLFEI